MYFKFECAHCGKSLRVREEHLGRKTKCPHCHQMNLVTPPEHEQQEAPQLRNALDDLADQQSTPRDGEHQPDEVRGGAAAWRSGDDGTNISMPLAALIGLGIAVAIYVVVIPFRDTYFGKLFIDTGRAFWVPPVEVFLTGWSIAILLLKRHKLAVQKESMLFDMLPTEIGDDIDAKNAGKFIKHLGRLPTDPGRSFLTNRVLRGLEHFRVRKSTPEVANMLSSQSDIDAAAVDSSYTIIKVFIWAIPILGFIGTVIGISAAVDGMALDSAGSVDEMKASLTAVTSGLGTAFNTTLVALVFSIFISIPASSMQKAEEDLLNWVDEYCNENLLKRLNDTRPDNAGGDGGGNGMAGVAQAAGRIEASFAALEKRLASLARTIDSVQSKSGA